MCDSHPAPVSSDTQMSTTLTQHHPCLQQSGALILKRRKNKGVKYSFNIQSQKQTPPLFSLKYPYDLFFMISSLCCSMNVLRKRLKSLQIHVISGTLLLTSVISRFHMEERHSQRLLCFIYFDILSFKCTVPTIQSLSTVATATNLPANVKKRTGVRFN